MSAAAAGGEAGGAAVSVLEREIDEQPEAIARTIEGSAAEIASLAAATAGREIDCVLIAARGSSDNAGVFAKYAFQAFNGLPVAMATPSLYTFHRRPPRLKNVMVLGISQSGRSEDIVEVLAEGRRQGALTAAVTADGSSPLAAQAAHVLLLRTGAERAVAATKTYTSSLALLAGLSAAMEGSRERAAAVRSLPDLARSTLDAARGPARERAERYRYMTRCVVIGRGFGYGTAMEIALKLKELTYVTAEPYSSADFLHGPMAMLEPGFPVVLVALQGTLLPHMREFAAALADRQAEIIAVSDAADILDAGVTRLPFVGGPEEWLAPVLAVMPGQLLACWLAVARGLDPDAPRGLRKVTVTR